MKEYIDIEFKVEFKEEHNGEYRVILNDKGECLNEIVLDEGWGEHTESGNEKWAAIEKKAKDAARGIWNNEKDD